MKRRSPLLAGATLTLRAALAAGLTVGLAVGLAAGLAGCAGSQATGEVTVFAAASLRDAFAQIAEENPDLSVRFSFQGSSTLLDDLRQGAPADVFATADEDTMNLARAEGLVEEPEHFTSNTLRLVVPAGNPARITGLDDSLEGKKLVLCAPRVPCGAASGRLAELLGVELHPVSEELKVSDVLGKVTSGEADAGLVYLTDALSAGSDVEVVEVERITEVTNDYPIARVSDSPHTEGAEAFIRAVTSQRGQEILAEHGFGR